MIYHQPGNSQGNFNFNFFRYSGTDYAPHFHKNLELICVCTGQMDLTVEGQDYVLLPGQMALVLSNQIHSFRVPLDADVWVAVFSQEYVPVFAAQVKGKRGKTAVFKPEEEIKIFLTRYLPGRNTSVMLRKACFYGVCDAYLSQVSLEQRSGKNSFLVGELLDWVSLHYTEDISLKKAAQVFGYEYHYLSRLLNQCYRINFVKLVSGYRVEHAIELLENTTLSVGEIASRSGFGSIRSCNLAFRNITGRTPNDYRAEQIDKECLLG